jgi:hypothetical protein
MNGKYYIGTALSMLLCILLCPSCEKGCTDPAAYNYQRPAKVNDGDCLYCDSSLITNSSGAAVITDDFAYSPYYEFGVLHFVVSSNFVSYSGNGCHLLGHNTNNNGTVATSYTAALLNETGSRMTCSGTIQIATFLNGAQTIFSFDISNLAIPAHGSVNIDLGDGGLQQEFNSFSITLLPWTFSYS